MQIIENIQQAWNILVRNKVRSFLTMLGIIIGVTSVVVIMSVGAGAQGLVLNQVKSLGSNLIGILPGKSDDNGPPAAVFGIVVTTLIDDDANDMMKSGFDHVVSVSSYARGASTMTANEAEIDSSFVGVSASYPEVEDVSLATGRFFDEEENKGIAKVAVLGSEVAKKLFGDENPLGREIKIKKTLFRIIGVVKERGVSGFQNQDDQVFVPVQTAQKLLLGINYVNFIRVKIDDGQYVDSSVEQIKEYLRVRHDIDGPENDDFSVRSSNQGLEALTSITDALKFFLAAIAAISLLVGGIGIMNIMLAAVEERTKEIGLRKAVGATNANIIVQFLIETVTITLLGGIIGIVLGSAISVAVAFVARSQGFVWDLVITPGSIILGCSVSIAIGLLFGITPARHASRLSPIEALRYE